MAFFAVRPDTDISEYTGMSCNAWHKPPRSEVITRLQAAISGHTVKFSELNPDFSAPIVNALGLGSEELIEAGDKPNVTDVIYCEITKEEFVDPNTGDPATIYRKEWWISQN